MRNHALKFLHLIKISVLGVWILLLLSGAIPAQGATYYVATAGSDSNPGTKSQPFKSFAQGVSKLEPGDTLYILGGLYTERIDLQTPNKTGTAGNYITIAGYPGETVTIRYASMTPGNYGNTKARGNRGYIIFENMIWDGIDQAEETQGISIRDGNHNFILRNIEIKNHKGSAIGIAGADNIKIINCKLHDQISPTGEVGQRYYGIYYHHGSNVLIEGNDIYNNPGGGIQVYPGPISNALIRNNSVHDNNWLASSNNEGIVVVTGGGNAITGVQLYNNLIYRNGLTQPSPAHSGGIKVSGASDTKIWNNTIYNNKGLGIAILWSAMNTVAQNNIVFANTLGEIVASSSGGSVLTHNLTSDPKFMNPKTFDLKLQSNSPAINAGTAISQVSTDFRNVNRPIDKAYDIGAYEGGISDSSSPTAPKDLSAK